MPDITPTPACGDGQRHERRQLLRDMQLLGPAARLVLILDACARTGGSLTQPSGPFGDHLADLRLLGVSGTGDTAQDAIRNWWRAAQTIEQADSAGTVAA